MIWDEGPRTALNSGQRLLASLLRFLDRDAETSSADGFRRFRNKHSLSFHGACPEACPNMYLFGVSVQDHPVEPDLKRFCSGKLRGISSLQASYLCRLASFFDKNLNANHRNEEPFFSHGPVLKYWRRFSWSELNDHDPGSVNSEAFKSDFYFREVFTEREEFRVPIGIKKYSVFTQKTPNKGIQYISGGMFHRDL